MAVNPSLPGLRMAWRETDHASLITDHEIRAGKSRGQLDRVFVPENSNRFF